MNDRSILLQYAINKHEQERVLIEKLSGLITLEDVEGTIIL